ncbi:hypothetical protein ACKWTF_003955 [Chironomus riparius]
MSELQKEIFSCIAKSDVDELKKKLSAYNGSIDFTDDNGMTPLQHASYKGNKEGVQLLLDLGADVNSGKHEFNYTALHFAALSGNADVCLQLLIAGANPSTLNSVGRTAAQMGAFVANHKAVSTINNFVSKSDIEYYTKIQGLQTEPSLPPALLDSFHKFVIHPNLHPTRIALNLQQYGVVSDNYKIVKNVLDLMTEREMKRKSETNELMAFKYHYLSWIIKEIISCRDHFLARNQEKDSKSDYLEMYIKRVMKQNKEGQMDYMELTIRECVREFPFRECMIFQQVVRQLADKENQFTALEIIKQAINGQRGFQDVNIFCSTCGDEKPDKKCSKCKQVQYCDRECQRLHWSIHKKECARLSSQPAQITTAPSNGKKEPIDQAELSEELQKLVAG